MGRKRLLIFGLDVGHMVEGKKPICQSKIDKTLDGKPIKNLAINPGQKKKPCLGKKKKKSKKR